MAFMASKNPMASPTQPDLKVIISAAMESEAREPAAFGEGKEEVDSNNPMASPAQPDLKVIISAAMESEAREPPAFGEGKKEEVDYSKRSQWLRAAVLGANDGLVSTASLMMGIGAIKEDIKAMIFTGFAGLVAGACSMAIGEFVSVYSQLDIEVAQMKRNKEKRNHLPGEEEKGEEDESNANPAQAAAASALAFTVGAMVPLLAASFIREYEVRMGVIIAAVTVALVTFGWLGAALGKAPAAKAALRVVVGGWLAMGITFGLTKFIGSRRF